MARKKKKRKPEEVKMDMTPMIDCTFLLIIFFLCLEFKTLEGKLAANLPDLGDKSSSATPVEKLDLRLEVAVMGTFEPTGDPRRRNLVGHKVKYWLGAASASNLVALDKLMREAVKVQVPDPDTGRKKPRPIVIKGSPGITYGDVTEVVDSALEAEFKEITFGGGEGTWDKPKYPKK